MSEEIDQELAGIDDEACEQWPEFLMEKYAALSLPSLYDFIVSQEKLAAEIRRQNQEIKNQENYIKALSQVTEELLEKFNENVDDLEDDLEYDNISTDLDDDDIDVPVDSATKDTRAVLMQAMDSLLNLLNGFSETRAQILNVVPKKMMGFLPIVPAWRVHLEQALETSIQGVATIKQKLLCQLRDIDVEIINPDVGTPFDPLICRALEIVKNGHGQKGCIAQVIRYGYRCRQEVLRSADVVIFE